MVIPLLSGEEVKPCLSVIDMAIDILHMAMDMGMATHITAEAL